MHGTIIFHQGGRSVHGMFNTLLVPGDSLQPQPLLQLLSSHEEDMTWCLVLPALLLQNGVNKFQLNSIYGMKISSNSSSFAVASVAGNARFLGQYDLGWLNKVSFQRQIDSFAAEVVYWTERGHFNGRRCCEHQCSVV